MIEARKLTKIYSLGKKKKFIAVDQVDLAIEKGEIFGLVGESGSGKSTLARMLLGLIPPTAGEIFLEGEKVTRLLPRRMQMVFQDPYSSLNPRMTAGALIEEPTEIHHLPSRVDELLELVGIPAEAKTRYPHQFSGGQRQRLGIARALALNPEVLICDEPISALDVSIQAQIVNLLLYLRKKLNLTLLFITHDLAMVRYLSDRIGVMQGGKIIEVGPTESLFAAPKHPYTQTLLSMVSILRFTE